MATYRLWPATNAPTTSDADAQAVTVGTEIYVTATSWVTAIHYFHPTTNPNTGSKTVGVYRVDSSTAGTVLVSKTHTPSGTGWQTVTLDTALQITSGTRYRIVTFYPLNGQARAGYVATGAYFAGATNPVLSNGPLNAPNNANATANAQGSYTYGTALSFPTSTFNGANYWVDATVSDVDPAAVPATTFAATNRPAGTHNYTVTAIVGGVETSPSNTYTGTVAGVATYPIAASGASTSAGTAALRVTHALSGSGSSTSTGTANAPLRLGSTASGVSASTGSAAAIATTATLVWQENFASLDLVTPGNLTARWRANDVWQPVDKGYEDFAGNSWNLNPNESLGGAPRSAFSIVDNALRISAIRTPDAWKADIVASDPADGVTTTAPTWSGGILISNTSQAANRFTYGYFEFRMRAPTPGKGMFPALWLFGANGQNTGKERAEIDLWEVFGSATGSPQSITLHQKKDPDGSAGTGSVNAQIDIATYAGDTTGYHTYALDWQPNYLHFYKDNVLVAAITGDAAKFYNGVSMAIRLNYSMDAPFFAAENLSDASTPEPLTMDVDYVHVWNQKPDGASPYSAPTDNFDRADSTGLGGNWNAPNFNVVSNRAAPTDTTNGRYAFYLTAAAADDMSAECEIVVFNSNMGVFINALSTGTLDTDTSSMYLFRYNGSQLAILKKTANASTFTTLGTPVTQSLSNGSILRLERQGSTLRGYVNGAVVITATDGTPITGQRIAGMRAFATNTGRFDDFLISGVTASAAVTHAISASGSSTSTGTASVAQGLRIAASGSSASTGTSAAALRMAISASGSSASAGTGAAALRMAVSASGSSASTGTAAAALRMAVTATGSSTSTGTAAAVQYAAATATGSSASTGTAQTATSLESSASGASTTAGSASLIVAPIAQIASLRTIVSDYEVLASATAGYVTPSLDDRNAFKAIWNDIKAGNAGAAALAADSYGYDVVDFTDTETNRKFWLLRERATRTRWWGMYAWNRDVGRTDRIVAAPHTSADIQTHYQAVDLLLQTNGTAGLWTGTHRNASSTLDADDDNITDVANVSDPPSSIFQAITEVTATASNLFVEPHGFAAGQVEPLGSAHHVGDSAVVFEATTAATVPLWSGSVFGARPPQVGDRVLCQLTLRGDYAWTATEAGWLELKTTLEGTLLKTVVLTRELEAADISRGNFGFSGWPSSKGSVSLIGYESSDVVQVTDAAGDIEPSTSTVTSHSTPALTTPVAGCVLVMSMSVTNATRWSTTGASFSNGTTVLTATRRTFADTTATASSSTSFFDAELTPADVGSWTGTAVNTTASGNGGFVIVALRPKSTVRDVEIVLSTGSKPQPQWLYNLGADYTEAGFVTVVNDGSWTFMAEGNVQGVYVRSLSGRFAHIEQITAVRSDPARRDASMDVVAAFEQTTSLGITASGASSSSGSGSLTAAVAVSASGSATSTGSAIAVRTTTMSATGASASAGSAVSTLTLVSSASGASAASGTASARLTTTVGASGSALSSGTASATGLLPIGASGLAQTAGSATTLLLRTGPTGLTGTISGSSVALTWNAVPGVTSYRVYRNGVLVGTVT